MSSDQSTEEEECEVQNGVCIIESAALSIFITDGKDYESALPFNVSINSLPAVPFSQYFIS